MKKSQLRVSVFISGRTNNLFWFRQNILALLLRTYQSWKNLSQKDYFLLGPPSWIIFHTKCSNCGWGSAWSTTYCTIGIKLPRSGWKIHTGSSLLSLLLGFLLGKIFPSYACRAHRTGAAAGSSAFRFPSGKWLVFSLYLRLRVEGFVSKLGLKFCRWVWSAINWYFLNKRKYTCSYFDRHSESGERTQRRSHWEPTCEPSGNRYPGWFWPSAQYCCSAYTRRPCLRAKGRPRGCWYR